MRIDLACLASGATFDVLHNKFPHAWPHIFPFNQIVGFLDSWVSHNWCVVMHLDYITIQLIIWWNIYSVLVQEYSVVVGPIFWFAELWAFGSLSF